MRFIDTASEEYLWIPTIFSLKRSFYSSCTLEKGSPPSVVKPLCFMEPIWIATVNYYMPLCLSAWHLLVGFLIKLRKRNFVEELDWVREGGKENIFIVQIVENCWLWFIARRLPDIGGMTRTVANTCGLVCLKKLISCKLQCTFTAH